MSNQQIVVVPANQVKDGFKFNVITEVGTLQVLRNEGNVFFAGNHQHYFEGHLNEQGDLVLLPEGWEPEAPAEEPIVAECDGQVTVYIPASLVQAGKFGLRIEGTGMFSILNNCGYVFASQGKDDYQGEVAADGSVTLIKQ